MSTILKALRRVEEESVGGRPAGGAPEDFLVQPGKPLRRASARGRWRAAGVALTAFALIGGFTWWLLRVPEVAGRDAVAAASEAEPPPQVFRQYAPENQGRLARATPEPAERVSRPPMRIEPSPPAGSAAEPLARTPRPARTIPPPVRPPPQRAPPVAAAPAPSPAPSTEHPAAASPRPEVEIFMRRPDPPPVSAAAPPVAATIRAPAAPPADDPAPRPAANSATATASPAVAAAPAPEPAVSAPEPPAAPAEAPVPEPVASPAALADAPAPAVFVETTRWHPDPLRRTARVRHGDAEAVTLQEGDRIGEWLLERIEPTGVHFGRQGRSLHRRVGER